MELLLLLNFIFAIAFVSTFLLSVAALMVMMLGYKEDLMLKVACILMNITAGLFFSLAIISGIYQWLDLHS